MATLIIIAGAALILFALYSTIQKARGKSVGSSCCGSAESVLTKPVEDTDESHYPFRYNVGIEGMSCSNCAARVENAINASGDTWAHVNLGRSRAEVLSKNRKNEADFARLLSGLDYRVTGCTSVTE